MKIDKIVEQMYPRRYTITQAAKLIERSPDTLRRWMKLGIFTPSDGDYFGKTWVYLFTSEDIRTLRRIAKQVKPGRVPTKNKKLHDKRPPLALVC